MPVVRQYLETQDESLRAAAWDAADGAAWDAAGAAAWVVAWVVAEAAARDAQTKLFREMCENLKYNAADQPLVG